MVSGYCKRCGQEVQFAKMADAESAGWKHDIHECFHLVWVMLRKLNERTRLV